MEPKFKKDDIVIIKSFTSMYNDHIGLIDSYIEDLDWYYLQIEKYRHFCFPGHFLTKIGELEKSTNSGS